LAVNRQPEHTGQVVVPAFVGRSAVGCSVFWQEIIIIRGKELGGEAPLFEVVEAGARAGFFLGSNKAARMAMIAITTRSSMSVKALVLRRMACGRGELRELK
jgi:hypothetical protein